MIGGLMKTTSYLAMAAAASLILGSVSLAPTAARAADLGGDCCADLETRVAELEATTVRKGNKKISVTLSGRVNANMIYWNDNAGVADSANDSSSDLYFGNYGGSESNFNLSGSGKLSADTTAGFYMEIRNDFNVKIGNGSQDKHQGGPDLSPQNMYVYLNNKRLGEVRLGRPGSASGDGFYVDYGASVLGGLSGGRFTGGFQVRDTAKNLTGKTYGGTLGEWTDNGGPLRIFYATPDLGGFVGKIADGGDNILDASITYHGKHGTLNYAAGVAYVDSTESDAVTGACNVCADAATRDTTWGVSASIFEESSGIFVSGAWDDANSNGTFFGLSALNKKDWFIRGGWQKNVTGMGLTSVDAQYERADNGSQNIVAGVLKGTSAHKFSVGIDQALDAVASNVYLRYNRDTVDDTAGFTNTVGIKTFAIDSQSIDSVTAGMIVRF